jgi:hypothetical protein
MSQYNYSEVDYCLTGSVTSKAIVSIWHLTAGGPSTDAKRSLSIRTRIATFRSCLVPIPLTVKLSTLNSMQVAENTSTHASASLISWNIRLFAYIFTCCVAFDFRRHDTSIGYFRTATFLLSGGKNKEKQGLHFGSARPQYRSESVFSKEGFRFTFCFEDSSSDRLWRLS